MKELSVFICGFLFALGLGAAGMTQPAKIIGFLDLAGSWDPALLFVMGGAVVFGFVSFPLVLRRPAPVLEERFLLPEKKRIDFRLLSGATLFGTGWGLAGYCPGPALVALVTLDPWVWTFATAMLAGLGLGRWFSQ